MSPSNLPYWMNKQKKLLRKSASRNQRTSWAIGCSGPASWASISGYLACRKHCQECPLASFPEPESATAVRCGVRCRGGGVPPEVIGTTFSSKAIVSGSRDPILSKLMKSTRELPRPRTARRCINRLLAVKSLRLLFIKILLQKLLHGWAP
jgi:hypothetical protein